MSTSTTNVSVSESAGTVTEKFGYYGADNGGAIHFYTVDGTAKNGKDYSFQPNDSVNYAGGVTAYPSETVNIIDNSIADASRYFDLVGRYPNGDIADYKITITDDGDTGVQQADGSILGTLKTADESVFEQTAKQVVSGAAEGIAKTADSKVAEDLVVDASTVANNEYTLIQKLGGAEGFDSAIDYNLLKLGAIGTAAKLTGLGVSAYTAIEKAYEIYQDPNSTAADVVETGAKSLATALLSGEVGEIAGTLVVGAAAAAGVPALAGIMTAVAVGGVVAGITDSYVKDFFNSSGVQIKDAPLVTDSSNLGNLTAQNVKTPSKVSVVDPAIVLDGKAPTSNWTYDPATGVFTWLTPQDPTTIATLQARLGVATNPITLTLNGDQNTDKNDVLYGGSGNDVINGLSGNDVIFGQAGDDVIHGGGGNDLLDGGPGNDTIYGDAGDDIILGGTGDDHLYGGAGNDTIYGGEGNDYIDGGDGDDVLGQYIASKNDAPNTSNVVMLASGNTNFVGGSGKNIIYALTSGQDIVVGGSGQDTIYGNPGHVTVDYSNSASAVNVNGIAGGHGGDAEGDSYLKVYNFVGSNYNDRFTGNATSYGVPWTFNMGAGDDIAEVGSGRMVVDGGLGNDTVVFHGTRSEYTVTSSADGNGVMQYTVKDNGAAGDGLATLTSVETLSFKDGAVALGPDAAAQTFGSVSFDTNGVAGQLYSLYEGLLGRAPDALGAEGWAASLASGTSIGQITQAFINSGEGQTYFAPNATDTAFVDQLYQQVLGRQADPAGEQSWVDTLANGITRVDVADAFVFSPEHVSQLQPALTAGVYAANSTASAVARLYYGLMGRAPDLGGLQANAAAVDAGTSIQTMADSFMQSAEYRPRMSMDNSIFVSNLYRSALGRSPDQAGLQSWVGALSNGTTSRAAVAVGIIESTEAQSFLSAGIEKGMYHV